MFATCLYLVLDPATGRVQYANAGHNRPYHLHGGVARRLPASGKPLGWQPDQRYEEHEIILEAGDSLALYSDGLVEARDPHGVVFGFTRLQDILSGNPNTPSLIARMLDRVAAFTGPDWRQSDDICIVTIQRCGETLSLSPGGQSEERPSDMRTLTTFSLTSEPGNERLAMRRVAEAVQPLNLSAARVARLQTAVAEATMNAIEHGNQSRRHAPVSIQVLASRHELVVRVIDQALSGEPVVKPPEPNLRAKLAGKQTPRGWGLFLIKHMVDDVRDVSDANHHIIELTLRLEQEDQQNTRR
jgi:anti-sigma regulatory factor (Ser/Thr protein kinase)